ncbi:NmrA family NAD(P)-binding protein [Cellulophaga sp. BC115SP]|uniref:NmrA family NAD(P)-binding protein n=1 Tax=Cellulophaga sp. BC115SP TaxID=2683263 RepID=UPI0014133442|nr:NmrA family NAD(P)-binding protein [Cellulophaga sp. BC115SP]NBB28346.1 NmrA family NAD(P)-binding protein [Cellulophaga sp. BC115SP]
MKITVTGSLGNIGKHLVKILVANTNEVTVISSNEDRKSAIEALGAQAAIGSITDTDFLVKTFIGSDAVFVMTPPNMGGQNIIENTVNAGKSYAEAIAKSGVQKVVMLSSIGAEYENGTGPIAGLYHIENLYRSLLQNVNVSFMRAGYFYTNFYNDVPLIKGMGIIGSNYPADTKIPLVHPQNIAEAVAEELQKSTTGHQVRYVVSDYVSLAEVAKAFGDVLGKQLPWVEFTDEQSLQGMQQAGLPAEMANLYTEMGTAIREGKLQKDFEANGAAQIGSIKIQAFAKEFAGAF